MSKLVNLRGKEKRKWTRKRLIEVMAEYGEFKGNERRLNEGGKRVGMSEKQYGSYKEVLIATNVLVMEIRVQMDN